MSKDLQNIEMEDMHDQERIKLKWEKIKDNYNKAIKALKRAREGLRADNLWELDEDTKILEGTIALIKKLERKLPLPIR